MMFVREFEIIPNEGGYLALPLDMDGGTEGDTAQEALAMAAEWLHLMALDALLHGKTLPGGTVGHSPREGGTVIAVAVPVKLSDAPSMTAAEAARKLGVSTARVARMCASGQLASWKVGATRMVACESVEERLASTPAPGRPKAAVEA
ncbi:MAG: helix-turn-helix domain-containing protein [Coriobacteriia bacterium]|nr:helix-turn-helix domain-containing protein [Coriobacteriia bacterium]MBS5477774.1 helix-turn-helix domain-containing protein [Coriobacteriia bacterium]